MEIAEAPPLPRTPEATAKASAAKPAHIKILRYGLPHIDRMATRLDKRTTTSSDALPDCATRLT